MSRLTSNSDQYIQIPDKQRKQIRSLVSEIIEESKKIFDICPTLNINDHLENFLEGFKKHESIEPSSLKILQELFVFSQLTIAYHPQILKLLKIFELNHKFLILITTIISEKNPLNPSVITILLKRVAAMEIVIIRSEDKEKQAINNFPVSFESLGKIEDLIKLINSSIDHISLKEDIRTLPVKDIIKPMKDLYSSKNVENLFNIFTLILALETNETFQLFLIYYKTIHTDLNHIAQEINHLKIELITNQKFLELITNHFEFLSLTNNLLQEAVKLGFDLKKNLLFDLKKQPKLETQEFVTFHATPIKSKEPIRANTEIKSEITSFTDAVKIATTEQKSFLNSNSEAFIKLPSTLKTNLHYQIPPAIKSLKKLSINSHFMRWFCEEYQNKLNTLLVRLNDNCVTTTLLESIYFLTKLLVLHLNEKIACPELTLITENLSGHFNYTDFNPKKHMLDRLTVLASEIVLPHEKTQKRLLMHAILAGRNSNRKLDFSNSNKIDRLVLDLSKNVGVILDLLGKEHMLDYRKKLAILKETFDQLFLMKIRVDDLNPQDIFLPLKIIQHDLQYFTEKFKSIKSNPISPHLKELRELFPSLFKSFVTNHNILLEVLNKIIKDADEELLFTTIPSTDAKDASNPIFTSDILNPQNIVLNQIPPLQSAANVERNDSNNNSMTEFKIGKSLFSDDLISVITDLSSLAETIQDPPNKMLKTITFLKRYKTGIKKLKSAFNENKETYADLKTQTHLYRKLQIIKNKLIIFNKKSYLQRKNPKIIDCNNKLLKYIDSQPLDDRSRALLNMIILLNANNEELLNKSAWFVVSYGITNYAFLAGVTISNLPKKEIPWAIFSDKQKGKKDRYQILIELDPIKKMAELQDVIPFFFEPEIHKIIRHYL